MFKLVYIYRLKHISLSKESISLESLLNPYFSREISLPRSWPHHLSTNPEFGLEAISADLITTGYRSRIRHIKKKKFPFSSLLSSPLLSSPLLFSSLLSSSLPFSPLHSTTTPIHHPLPPLFRHNSPLHPTQLSSQKIHHLSAIY